jgi:hypothetical protein
MRDRLTVRDRLTRMAHWLVVPLALVAHAACQQLYQLQPDVGSRPWSGKVVCNIEKPSGRHCASPADVAMGIRLAAAAEALATGQTSTIGIDDSPAALARCNGQPEAVEFEGPFPQGAAICLNCSVVTASSDANELCVQRCQGETDPAHVPPLDSVRADCLMRAHAATNFAPTACTVDACTADGYPIDSFTDPPRSPESVDWQDRIGVDVVGDVLIRTAAATNNFDAGAASSQTIAGGDGYVEFGAVELATARLCGLSNGAPPDTNPDYADIDFAIDLFKDGRYYVFESGTKVAGPDLNQSFGTYAGGDVFRVHVKDQFDGTATVTYSHIEAACAGSPSCPETVFYTSAITARYPLRVDSSFREQNGTLSKARLVRIQ